MKPIRIESGIIVYYGNRVGSVTDGRAVVDPMFQGAELNDFLKKQRNIQEVKWMDGMFERLMSRPKDTREMQTLKNCRVWQLKPDVDIRMKFIGYDELCRDFGPPDSNNYQKVFDGAVETNDLEALYTKFNLNHPPGYEGHSLSMSDVLELYDESVSTFHYMDRIGFQNIAFHKTQPALEEADPVLEFYHRMDAEYDAYLKEMTAKPQAELIRNAAEIAGMTAVYEALRNNLYLDFDGADDLKQLEWPLEAIWQKLPQKPVISEQAILDAYQEAASEVFRQSQNETSQTMAQSPTMQF